MSYRRRNESIPVHRDRTLIDSGCTILLQQLPSLFRVSGNATARALAAATSATRGCVPQLASKVRRITTTLLRSLRTNRASPQVNFLPVERVPDPKCALCGDYKDVALLLWWLP